MPMSVLDADFQSNPCRGEAGGTLSEFYTEYLEISCVYPFLGKFYTKKEKFYDSFELGFLMNDRPWLPLLAVTLYAVFIVAGKKYFSAREALDWRRPMACWNFLLSSFSLIGLCRTLPMLLHNLATYSLHDNFCMDGGRLTGCGSSGLWIQLFVLSKFPELFDTFFIVIHKKQLIFLHWYHHITVLLFSWHSYVNKAPQGIFFVTMNYAVHSLMYFYYFLMAVGCKPKSFKAIYITVAQISQMVVGVAVTCLGFYYYKTDSKCAIKPENNAAGFVMYGSYLLLFVQFFMARFMKPSKKQANSKSGKEL